MVKENAPELQLIKFPYELIPLPQSPSADDGASNRRSQILLLGAKQVSETVVLGAKDVSESLYIGAKDVSENLITGAKDVSENLLSVSGSLINGAKDKAETMVEETNHFLRKAGSLHSTTSSLSHKTRSIIQKGAEKVKTLAPSEDQFRSRRLGRFSSQLAERIEEGKEKIHDFGVNLKEMYQLRPKEREPRWKTVGPTFDQILGEGSK